MSLLVALLFADGVAVSYVPAAANKLNLRRLHYPEFIVLVQKCMEMQAFFGTCFVLM